MDLYRQSRIAIKVKMHTLRWLGYIHRLPENKAKKVLNAEEVAQKRSGC